MNPSSGHRPLRVRIVQCFFAAGMALTLYYVAVQFFLVRLRSDPSWLLYAADKVLSGVGLYGPQLTETNPPLIVWISLLPALIARVGHLSPLWVFRALVMALIAGTALWNRRILSRSSLNLDGGRLVLVFAFALCALMISPGEFGQREQLVVILLLPYVLAVATGAIERLTLAELCLLGAVAGVAVCLKPFQVLVVVCFEIFFAAYTRSLRRIVRPELIAMVGACVIYLFLIFLITPLYYKETMPILSETYWAFGRYTLGQMLAHKGSSLTLGIVLASAVWILVRRRCSAPLPAGALLACAAGAWLAYEVQHTGWPYQKFPAYSFLAMATVWLVLDLAILGRKIPLGKMRPALWQWATALVFAGVLFGWAARKAQREQKDERMAGTVANELASYPRQTHMYIFSTDMESFPIVVERNLVWSSRFAHLWMLPALIENEYGPLDKSRRFHAIPPGKLAALEDIQRKDTAADLSYWRPEYVLMERCPYSYACAAIDSPFDMLGWFQREPEFAQEWNNYTKVRSVENYDVYQRAAP